MLEIGLLKFGHVICLAYWLGTDLGVFYSSYFVADRELSAETRLSMSRLLFALDQGPRLCMPLILATGVHLAALQGWFALPPLALAAAWSVCLGWVAMVIVLHRRGPAAKALTTFDYWFRVAAILGIGGVAGHALLNDAFADWLAVKLLVFAALVASGLMIRRKLRPFGPAFAALAAGRATDADDAAIRDSLASTRPFVVAIWAGLLVNTALGIHLL